MGRTRLVSIAALLAAGSVALAACSSSTSDNKTASPSSGTSSTGSSQTAGGPGGTTCATGTLDAAGSTAQTNAMDGWRKAYQQGCSGATINYTPTSSGDGVTAFNNGSLDFAGSDSALDPKAGEVAAAQTRCKSTPLDLPMVVGPIAVAFKLKGVDKLTLTGPVIAKMFLGKISAWNDPEIAKLNSGAKLPSTKITPFFRSDASGTTKNFEKYLQATAPTVFTSEPDKDSSKAGFAGQGKAKSQGVAASISQTEGGVGYVEYSFAVGASLSTASVDNGGGAVELSPDTASAAAGTAKIVGKGSDLSLSIDYAQKTPGSYPLILVTYEVVCTKYSDSAKGTLVKNFLNYTVGAGQSTLKQEGYAPLPAALQQKVKASVASIS